jgi:deazaflavin-dependent oxidoreductase (nitroreductase family)
MTYDRANPLQRILRRFAASGPGSWLFARVLHHIDRPVHRLTRGRYMFSSLVSGLPVVMLTTTGARSGQRRTAPVLGIPTEGSVAIIASNYGREHNPAWYYNLRSHPDAEVVIHGQRGRVRATEATDDRRAHIWQDALRMYPGFDQYERRAAHRHIAVFVLDPISASEVRAGHA